jgi:16S rRNA A1518/A1519 N6-dimethyltransferase RsmA/KsgA/DIM1 with predicted DNA glycosylase/AP lyase activity
LEQNIENLLGDRGVKEDEAIAVGNLPYYITSPIFKHLFWKNNPKLL